MATELTMLFTNIANAIREQNHSTTKIQANNFPNEIKNIKTGFSVDEINKLIADTDVVLLDKNNKQYEFSTQGMYNNILRLAPKLITFTVRYSENYTFQAEPGMTWVEWINSEYNTWNETSLVHWYGDGVECIIHINEDNYVYVDPYGRAAFDVYDEDIGEYIGWAQADDAIIPNAQYDIIT